MGYLSNKSDYYKQDNITFQLKQQVAKESGNYNHYLLISLLFTNSILYRGKNNNIYVADHRAAQAILFTLPLPIQALLSVYLYYLEKKLESTYSYLDYELVSNILLPSEILYINCKVINTTLSSTSLSILNNPLSPLSLELMPKLFGYSPPLDSLPIEDNLVKIFNYFNYSYSDNLVQLIRTNSRREALSAICTSFKYSNQTQSNLLSILELWELKNSNN